MSNITLINRPPVFSRIGPSTIPKKMERLYGVGISYPTTISENSVRTSKNEQRIRDSIYIILTTPIGTRFRMPEFGSLLPYMIFQQINYVFFDEAKTYTEESITRWEPRISLKSVVVSDADAYMNIIHIYITYVIKGVGLESNTSISFSIENDGQPVFLGPDHYHLGGRSIVSRGII